MYAYVVVVNKIKQVNKNNGCSTLTAFCSAFTSESPIMPCMKVS